MTLAGRKVGTRTQGHDGYKPPSLHPSSLRQNQATKLSNTFSRSTTELQGDEWPPWQRFELYGLDINDVMLPGIRPTTLYPFIWPTKNPWGLQGSIGGFETTKCHHPLGIAPGLLPLLFLAMEMANIASSFVIGWYFPAYAVEPSGGLILARRPTRY